MDAAFDIQMRAYGFPLIITEIADGESLTLADGVILRALKVPHTMESVAYSMEYAGRRITYSGDCAYDERFGAWAKGSDLLLLECSLPPEFGVKSHLTPAECSAIAAIAQPSHLVLTHFYPPVERTDIVGVIRTTFAGPVTLASDGDRFMLQG
jgi:ribonuclease BN (tRNA processing enzyme)